jgi:diadenosine tetraphosphate (Ap4A) HIT family hydrolase
MTNPCELCAVVGGELMHQTEFWRVVRVDDANYPGFCRVIWQQHQKEMNDLTPDQRQAFMQAVFTVEDVVRRVMQPDKINLASLGNLTPHLHWHVIPRFVDDSHFPQPIWGSQQRVPDQAILAARHALAATLLSAIPNAFKQGST